MKLSWAGFALVVCACSPVGSDPAGPRELDLLDAPERVRRLSVWELENTLSDLFPGLVVPDAPSLPRDPRLNGFTNDAASLGVSQLHVRRLERVAAAYAAAASDEAYLETLLPCDAWDTPAEQSACGRRFLRRFLRDVLRRPPTDPDLDAFDSALTGWRTQLDFRAAIQLSIVRALLAPEFLYRLEPSVAADGNVPTDAYDLANRVSYALWGSMPDEALFAAAADGSLLEDEILEDHARRLLDDPRARRRWVRFHSSWLGLDDILSEEHASRLEYPAWDAQTQRDALDAAERFFGEIFDSEPTLSAMFLRRTAFVNANLAAYYDVTAPASGWSQVELPSATRAGILTRIATLAARSHPAYGSPPLRGNFVRTRVLCGAPLNPPADADLSQPTSAEFEGARTNRQLFEARASGATCQGCHVELDGLGFGFEAFDAAGTYRTQEAEQAIDASGLLLGTDVDGPFTGAVELSERLAESETVQHCYVRRTLQSVYGRVFEPSEDLVLMHSAHFRATGGNARTLLVDVVTHPRFRMKSARSE